MTMLHKLALHADKSGWSDKYTMAPISDMYRSRLIPSIIPTVLVIFVAVAQLLSLELKEERRERRKLKKDKENAPAPSVLADDESYINILDRRFFHNVENCGFEAEQSIRHLSL